VDALISVRDGVSSVRLLRRSPLSVAIVLDVGQVQVSGALVHALPAMATTCAVTGFAMLVWAGA